MKQFVSISFFLFCILLIITYAQDNFKVCGKNESFKILGINEDKILNYAFSDQNRIILYKQSVDNYDFLITIGEIENCVPGSIRYFNNRKVMYFLVYDNLSKRNQKLYEVNLYNNVCRFVLDCNIADNSYFVNDDNSVLIYCEDNTDDTVNVINVFDLHTNKIIRQYKIKTKNNYRSILGFTQSNNKYQINVDFIIDSSQVANGYIDFKNNLFHLFWDESDTDGRNYYYE